MPGLELLIKELANLFALQARITGPGPYLELKKHLEIRLAEGRVTPFEEMNIERRINPGLILAGCKSIIVLAMPYPSFYTDSPGGTGPRGEIARFARGPDYHRLLHSRASGLVQMLEKELGRTFQHRILVDRNPLVERGLAARAGLGITGHNCNVYVENNGSYVALGTIITDLKLEADSAPLTSCTGCNRCINACPTGALKKPFIIDPQRCLSYLTQKSGIFPIELRPLLGSQIYGCDRCQKVCPLNSDINGNIRQAGHRPSFKNILPVRPLLLPFLNMTDKEFKYTVGKTAAGWRGKTTLQRNVIIALGNSRHDMAIPALAHTLETNPRPVLRLHSAWSLGRIAGKQAHCHLETAYRREPNREVKNEILLALGKAYP